MIFEEEDDEGMQATDEVDKLLQCVSCGDIFVNVCCMCETSVSLTPKKIPRVVIGDIPIRLTLGQTD